MSKLLNDSITLHKQLLSGEKVDLEFHGFLADTPINEAIEYNRFTILTLLQFPKEEATKSGSNSAKLLQEIARTENVETVIDTLESYRKTL
mgnify:CR=1 FL=1